MKSCFGCHKTNVKLITPKIAELLLSNNSINRSVKDSLVNEYARQMSADLWKEETGEAIKISVDGDILDGQHRLLALIKANKELSFLVISELERDIFTVLDTGVTRSAGDIFHIAGIQNAVRCAAIITKYLALKRGNNAVLSSRLPGFGGSAGITLKNIKYSKAELFAVYNSRIKFWEATISMSEKWYVQIQRVITLTEIGAIYAYLFDINEDDAIDLLHMFFDNEQYSDKLEDCIYFGHLAEAWRPVAEGPLI